MGRVVLDEAVRLQLAQVVAGLPAALAQVLQRWLSTGDTPEWEGASLNDRTTADLTLEELQQVVLAVQEVVDGAVKEAKARKAAGETEGRRRVRIYVDALPLPRDDDA